MSRITERLRNTKFIAPVILSSDLFHDQFYFRPMGSTTAAIIAITTEIVSLLVTDNYVRLISFDYSKAFDTLKHVSVMNNYSTLYISDAVYKWLCN